MEKDFYYNLAIEYTEFLKNENLKNRLLDFYYFIHFYEKDEIIKQSGKNIEKIYNKINEYIKM